MLKYFLKDGKRAGGGGGGRDGVKRARRPRGCSGAVPLWLKGQRMPTYEYLCTSCNNAWEEIQKISEAALEVCPKCGKSTARRQISGGNFILKGGGWYADLYSSSGGKKADKGESNGASSSS